MTKYGEGSINDNKRVNAKEKQKGKKENDTIFRR